MADKNGKKKSSEAKSKWIEDDDDSQDGGNKGVLLGIPYIDRSEFTEDYLNDFAESRIGACITISNKNDDNSKVAESNHSTVNVLSKSSECLTGSAFIYPLPEHCDHLLCQFCKNSTSFIMQIYAPLEGGDRVIYVFTCLNKGCMKPESWRVFRQQTSSCSCDPNESIKSPPVIQTTTTKPKEATTAIATRKDESNASSSTSGKLFDVSTSWGDDNLSSIASASIEITSQNSKEDQSLEALLARMESTSLSASASSSEKKQKKQEKPKKPKEKKMQIHFLDIIEEPEANSNAERDHALKLLARYEELTKDEKSDEQISKISKFADEDDEDGNDDGGGDSNDDDSEDENVPLTQRLFLSFSKRLSRQPDQCIRYQYEGEPLWPDVPPSSSKRIPKCEYCGSERVFEFQILPPLLTLPMFKDKFDEMEFQSIFVYTCKRSCGEEKTNKSLKHKCGIHQRQSNYRNEYVFTMI